MVRLSKLTDYAIVLLSSFCREGEPVRAARDLAHTTRLPLPTVSKILKSLSRAGFVESLRGAHGGYRLARRPDQITVAEVISTMEGGVALTDCATAKPCEFETACPMKNHWRRINDVVKRALEHLTLQDMADPQSPLHEPSLDHDHQRGTGSVPTLTLLDKRR